MSATTDQDTDLQQLHDLTPACDRRHPHGPEPARWSTLWAPTCAHGHFPRTKFRDAVLSLDPLQ